MPTRGKKYAKAAELVDRSRKYEPEEACELVKQATISSKFDESVEVAVRLGVNPRHADQMVRGAVVLPHGTGRSTRVLVIAKPDKAAEATAAGADFAGGEDIVAKIQKENWLEFDSVVATPDMMGQVGRLGRILGPRGMMPNPKVGTVTFDVAKAVKELKGGRVEFRVEKAGIIHALVGKASFPTEKLTENFYALIETLLRLKPSTAKGIYLRSVTMSTTFGPGIRLDPVSLASSIKI